MYVLPVLLFFMSSCASPPTSSPLVATTTSRQLDELNGAQAAPVLAAPKHVGSFTVATRPAAANPDDIFFELAHADRLLPRLVAADEIIVPAASAVLIIDYPLARPARFTVSAASAKGFTRGELAGKIVELYRQIYAREAATTRTPLQAPNRPRRGNRITTDGEYGIWGHDLEDLVLEGLDVYRGDDGSFVVSPTMGS